MPAASGVFKQLAYKVETTIGTKATNDSTAKFLRRVTSDLNLVKETYQSAEIRTDQQMQDMRHGTRRVEGTIRGELSPGTYAPFVQSALRRDFAAVTAISSLTLTITGASAPYTVTRSTGSFLTDGVKKGHVVRLSGANLAAGNVAKNLLVTNVTALDLTVIPLNGLTLTAESSKASSTVTVAGKVTYAPTSGHTNKSFSIEHYFGDITKSEVYLGCFPTALDIQLPASGLATVGIGMQGLNVETAGAQWFSSASAATTTGLLAAVNGVLTIDGTAVATLTGLTLNVASGRTGEAVVGSNAITTLFPGRITVSGQATALFETVTLRDAFLNETEFSLCAALTTGTAADSDFVSIFLPRVKANGHTVSDGEGGLVATIPFQALLPTTGGSGLANEMTTIQVQDSAAP